jgi:NADH-ubiquinone oxidoreductase chain 1
MLYLETLISIIEVIALVVPVLLIVAFTTISERKTMASMQRRLGPNAVGWYGLLQAFADALKLLLKEYISPAQATTILFFLGPIITLVFSLNGYAVIPLGSDTSMLDYNLGILYLLAMSSLSTYGILLAGWSANSKYAFLGSLRSTAQLISYELILSSVILVVVLLCGSLKLSVIIESQKPIWFIIPLFPVFCVFFIAAVAETNRAPFDLAEAESELVSGFMTEHSSVIFVFFFLAEYASIVLICILTTILFLGGYIFFSFTTIMYIPSLLLNEVFIILEENFFIDSSSITSYELSNFIKSIDNLLQHPSTEKLLSSLIIGSKTSILIYIFIWVRASYPRVRFDQLMSFCWTVLLPVVISFIILIPCILYNFDIIPCNIALL